MKAEKRIFRSMRQKVQTYVLGIDRVSPGTYPLKVDFKFKYQLLPKGRVSAKDGTHFTIAVRDLSYKADEPRAVSDMKKRKKNHCIHYPDWLSLVLPGQEDGYTGYTKAKNTVQLDIITFHNDMVISRNRMSLTINRGSSPLSNRVTDHLT